MAQETALPPTLPPHWNAGLYRGRTITPNELVSLTAMINYVAHVWGQSALSVERQIVDLFNIPNIKLLPSADYDSAIHHLVDCLPESFIA